MGLLGEFRRDLRVVLWSEERLIYIRVPKCGNTSISRAIPEGQKCRISIRRLKRLYPGWLAFSFVRNPWDRLVSTYHQKVDLENANPEMMIDGVYRGFRERHLPVRPDMTFEAFAKLVCSIPDSKTDKHLRSQTSFLVRDGRLVVDVVGQLERVDEDWGIITRKAGASALLPHLNRTRHEPYSAYYRDPQIVNLVADRYREDIDRFGYEAPSDG